MGAGGRADHHPPGGSPTRAGNRRQGGHRYAAGAPGRCARGVHHRGQARAAPHRGLGQRKGEIEIIVYILNGTELEIVNSDFVERFCVVRKDDATLIVASYSSARSPVTLARYAGVGEAKAALQRCFMIWPAAERRHLRCRRAPCMERSTSVMTPEQSGEEGAKLNTPLRGPHRARRSVRRLGYGKEAEAAHAAREGRESGH